MYVYVYVYYTIQYASFTDSIKNKKNMHLFRPFIELDLII